MIVIDLVWLLPGVALMLLAFACLFVCDAIEGLYWRRKRLQYKRELIEQGYDPDWL
jgi:hypothetical protein